MELSSTCVVCLEVCSVDGGITPSDCSHFICNSKHNDCLTKYISNNVCPNVFKMKDSFCAVSCPGIACSCRYDDLDVFFGISDDSVRARFVNILESVVDNQIVLEANKELCSQVAAHRAVFLDCLTLRCGNPACNMPVDPQPDACSAIMCLSCGLYYCNCCFRYFPPGHDVAADNISSSALAHQHVATHHPDYNTQRGAGGDAFVPLKVTRRLQLRHQTDQLGDQLVVRLGVQAGDRAARLAFICCYKSIVELVAEPDTAAGDGDGSSSSNVSAASRAVAVMESAWRRLAETLMQRLAVPCADAARAPGPPVVDASTTMPPATSAGVEEEAQLRVCMQLFNAVRTSNMVAVTQLLTPLHRAALSGGLGATRLLERVINYTDKETGYPVLIYTLTSRQYQIASLLVQCGADVLSTLSVAPANSRGRCALYVIFEHGLLSLAKLALEYHYKKMQQRRPQAGLTREDVYCYLVNAPLAVDVGKYSALHVLARHDVSHLIEFVVGCGADLNAVEAELGFSPLVLAVVSASADAAETLVELGAELVAGYSVLEYYLPGLASRRTSQVRETSRRVLEVFGGEMPPVHKTGNEALYVIVEHGLTMSNVSLLRSILQKRWALMKRLGLASVPDRLLTGYAFPAVGLSLLHHAAECNCPQAIGIILRAFWEQSRAMESSEDASSHIANKHDLRHGLTPLGLALRTVRHDRSRCEEAAIELLTNPYTAIQPRSADPLMHWGSVVFVDQRVQCGQHIYGALFMAIREGHVAVVQALLEQIPPSNPVDLTVRNPPHLGGLHRLSVNEPISADRARSPALVTVLLHHTKYTPPAKVAQPGLTTTTPAFLPLWRTLLDPRFAPLREDGGRAPLDINMTEGEFFCSALSLAVAHNSIFAARSLLEYRPPGADPGLRFLCDPAVPNVNGRTALFVVIEKGFWDLAQLLLEYSTEAQLERLKMEYAQAQARGQKVMPREPTWDLAAGLVIDTPATTEEDLWTPLEVAAHCNRKHIVRHILNDYAGTMTIPSRRILQLCRQHQQTRLPLHVVQSGAECERLIVEFLNRIPMVPLPPNWPQVV